MVSLSAVSLRLLEWILSANGIARLLYELDTDLCFSTVEIAYSSVIVVGFFGVGTCHIIIAYSLLSYKYYAILTEKLQLSHPCIWLAMLQYPVNCCIVIIVNYIVNMLRNKQSSESALQ